MYHIRRVDTKEERSLHQETIEGFSAAINESILRAAYTGVQHEVVDDDGVQLGVTEDGAVEVLPVPMKPTVRSWAWSPAFWLLALLTAEIIFGLLSGH